MKHLSSYVLASILCAGIAHGKPMRDENRSSRDENRSSRDENRSSRDENRSSRNQNRSYEDNENMSNEDSFQKGENMTSADKKTSQKLLNELLANETVMLLQTLNYHWNLTGPEFHDYHLLFDKQYNALFADLDKLAERVRAVEGEALGSMKHMMAKASLKEDTGATPAPKQMVKNLLKQYEDLINQIRDDIKKLEKSDPVSSNFLQDLAAQHEKTAWMLRSLTGK